MAKEVLEIWPLKILAYLGSAVIFELGPFLRAYNSVGSKGMSLKISVLNNLIKELQKTDI